MEEKIAIISNNINILKCFVLLCQQESYEILTFKNPLNALEKLKETGAAVVISDQSMYEMEGFFFLQKIKEILPETIRIIMISDLDTEAVITAVKEKNIFYFIKKPFDIQELDLIIRNAIHYYRMAEDNKKLIQINKKQKEELDKADIALGRQKEEKTQQIMEGEEKLEKMIAQLQESFGAIIQAMQLTIEAKNPYTAGHHRRVTALAHAIADEMSLSTDRIERIRMAGVIHDLGKIFEPEDILNKPSYLTDSEFDLIKNHPKVGYAILKQIKFLWPIASIVLQHHERMDGSGYPQGISGKRILLESRILAVADVVEAMVSHRPYRAAFSIDEALEEIEVNKGKLYDTEVADACLKLFNEKGFKLD